MEDLEVFEDRTGYPLFSGPTCPNDRLDVYCRSITSNSTQRGLPFHPMPSAYLSLASSSLSCLGSILIVFVYLRWKDVRAGSRSVITYLAIADFFTAAGYILGSSNYILHWNEPSGSVECNVFEQICEIQSFITSTSSLMSFLWTAILALYLYLTIVRARIGLANRLMPYFHVVSWGIPTVVVLAFLCAGKLGFSPVAASSWCYIGSGDPLDPEADGPPVRVRRETVAWQLIAGKLLEMLTYVWIIVLYVQIKRHLHKNVIKTSNSLSSENLICIIQRMEKKLIFIPVLFIILRMWGTLQFLLSQAFPNITESCLSQPVYTIFHILALLQAIGDGGQGWGNAFLYVFLTPKIRRRLLCMCCNNTQESTGGGKYRAYRRFYEPTSTVSPSLQTHAEEGKHAYGSIVEESQTEVTVSAESSAVYFHQDAVVKK